MVLIHGSARTRTATIIQGLRLGGNNEKLGPNLSPIDFYVFSRIRKDTTGDG